MSRPEDELANLLTQNVQTSKEVLDEELHRHIKSRTGRNKGTEGDLIEV